MSSGPCELQLIHTDISRSCAGLVNCGEARQTTEHATVAAGRPGTATPPGLWFAARTHLGVLQPHLQPLHGQQPHFLVAAGGREQAQEVPGHAVDGLAAVELVTKHVQDVLFHTVCELIVPRPEVGKGGQEGCQLRGPPCALPTLGLSAHLPWHELPFLLRAQLLLSYQQLCLTVLLFCERGVGAAACRNHGGQRVPHPRDMEGGTLSPNPTPWHLLPAPTSPPARAPSPCSSTLFGGILVLKAVWMLSTKVRQWGLSTQMRSPSESSMYTYSTAHLGPA